MPFIFEVRVTKVKFTHQWSHQIYITMVQFMGSDKANFKKIKLKLCYNLRFPVYFGINMDSSLDKFSILVPAAMEMSKIFQLLNRLTDFENSKC